jgi:hypothetical protein
MTISTPTPIETIQVFGYVFDDKGDPIEGARIEFSSNPFTYNDNTYRVDEVVTSDSAGRYIATLPKTEQVGEIITVVIKWTDADGNPHRHEEKIITGDTDPISVQAARAVVTPTKVVTGGPQGPPGPQGAPGVGLNWTGPWNSLTNYAVDDGVEYNGSSYVATAANINLPPDVNPSEWDLIAQKGADGAGETNTASNTGTGSEVFKQKVGVDLEFRRINASGVLSAIQNADDITLTSTAEPNQTDSEIKTQYENNADTNAFTDAEQTKLAGIEAGAEVNQTDAEIKIQYENNADTNAFTDAEQTKLAGIEAGAEVNQTDAEIKTQYENNPDTNAFTDAEQTKLAGIEAGATAETGSLVAPPAIAVTGAAGTDTGVYANDDHTHAHGAQTDETLHALATPGANGFMSAADKTKLNGIETGATADAASGVAPPDVAAAGAAGTDTNTYANSDHTHGHGNQAGGSLHALAVAGVSAGFMSAADKTKLDGLGAGTATQDFFFPMGNLITNYSEYAVATVGANGTGYCSFKVPADFTTLTSLELVGIIDPAAAGGGKNIDFFSSYGAIGEDRNNHAESDTSGATNLTGLGNQLYSFDISGVFTLLAAGDYAGIRVLHNSIGGNIYYLGVRLKYT